MNSVDPRPESAIEESKKGFLIIIAIATFLVLLLFIFALLLTSFNREDTQTQSNETEPVENQTPAATSSGSWWD